LSKLNIKTILRKNNYLDAIGERRPMDITNQRWKESSNVVAKLHLSIILSSIVNKTIMKKVLI